MKKMKQLYENLHLDLRLRVQDAFNRKEASGSHLMKLISASGSKEVAKEPLRSILARCLPIA